MPTFSTYFQTVKEKTAWKPVIILALAYGIPVTENLKSWACVKFLYSFVIIYVFLFICVRWTCIDRVVSKRKEFSKSLASTDTSTHGIRNILRNNLPWKCQGCWKPDLGLKRCSGEHLSSRVAGIEPWGSFPFYYTYIQKNSVICWAIFLVTWGLTIKNSLDAQ